MKRFIDEVCFKFTILLILVLILVELIPNALVEFYVGLVCLFIGLKVVLLNESLFI